MGRLSIIEERLKALNQATFQELCDSYLILKKPQFKVISRTGSQGGKEKTTKGVPDSFVLLSDNTYIFIEYTTQQTELFKKLKSDISNCTDETKTQIPVSKILEIILCFNSKLKVSDAEDLTKFANSLGIKVLKLITIDELALQLHLHHRNLAKDYLGLSLDTGQIIPLGQFVQEY
ncbi:MAG TPA: ATP-binding protein, partial [Cyclobacteriaceae bacterium]|nr:ATP-binding protein [Cyclobacteriaceae bacterium]